MLANSSSMDYQKKNHKELINELKELQQKYNSLKKLYKKDITEHKQAEKERLENEARYRALVESSPDAITQTDLNGRILMCNMQTALLHGYERPEDLIGKSAFELFSPDEQERASMDMQKTLKVGVIKNIEYRFLKKDGSQFQAELSATLIADTEGKPNSFMALTRNISERKRMEEELHESEQHYKMVSELATDYVFKIGIAANGKVTMDFVSDNFFSITGRTKEDALTVELWNNFIHPDDMGNVIRHFHRLIVDPQSTEFECRSYIHGHKLRCIYIIARSEWDEHENRVTGIIGAVKDISDRKLVEEALKTSEERYRHLVETTDTGYVIIDNNGVVLDANPEYIRLSGHEKLDEILGRSVVEWTADEEKESNARAIATCMRNGFIRNLELKYIDKTGNQTPVEINATTIEIEGKQEIVSLCRDITERKQAEEALSRSHERYKLLYEYAPVGILLVNRSGQILDVNPAAVQILGSPSAEATKGINLLTFPLLIEAGISAAYKRCFETGQTVFEEYPYISKWGKAIHMLMRLVPIFDKHNQVDMVHSIMENITERKQIELLLQEKNKTIEARNKEFQQQNEELNQTNLELIEAKEKAEESEEAYRMLFENINDAIFVIELTENGKPDKFIQVNDNACKRLGYTKEEFFSLTPYDINSENSKKAIPALMLNILEKKHAIIEMEHLTKDGSIIPVEISTKVTKFKNKPVFLSIARDITERKQAENEIIKAKEKAEESDHLKTAFLQNMSHEIRTPMNAIIGFSELMTENYNNKPKLEKFSEIINRRCIDLLEIINDILDIAKIESGQLPVTNEECNLPELFAELSSFFTEYQKRIGKQQIMFSMQALCDLSENVLITDRVKLKQIFINLISNAFKFTDKGKIEGGCRLDANLKLIFYVSDTGIGIPPDKHDAIFERFAQLVHDKKHIYGGTGLGLSIVKGLLNLLGGKIWIESVVENLLAEKAGGTTFYFSFPYELSRSVYHKPVLTNESREYHFSGKTILVVEDDLYNAAYFKEILSDTGLNIIHAVNGHEAFQIIASQIIDLVLMDIRLPDIDGYKAIRQIKQQKPNLKIIAQTAYAAHDDKQKAYDAGCIDYISKPLKRNMLLSMINKYL